MSSGPDGGGSDTEGDLSVAAAQQPCHDQSQQQQQQQQQPLNNNLDAIAEVLFQHPAIRDAVANFQQ